MRRVALAGFVLAGCSSPPPVARPTPVEVADAGARPAAVVAAPAPRTPANWQPGKAFVDIGAGRRGALIRNRRLVLEGSNITPVDAQPITGLGYPLKIPDGLGGGWVFLGSTGLRFAKTFDGALVMVAPSVDRATDGFGVDRVVVKGTTYELSTGTPVSPPVPGTVQLFGLPTGQVAARAKNGDVHLSTAKGKPFTKVASSIEFIAYDGEGYVLQSSAGSTRLTLDGKVGPLRAGPGMTVTDNVMAFGEFPSLSRPPPKEPTIERMVAPLAVAMDDGNVLVVEDNDLVAFDGKRGVELSRQKDAFAKRENCFPIRGGTPAFFGCNGAAGMGLFRVEAVDRPPVQEKTFPHVVTSDFGFPAPGTALVFSHRCDGTAALGAFCVRKDEQSWSEIIVNDPQQLLGRAPFLAGLVATKEGAAYGFAWQNGSGPLVVVDASNGSIRALQKSDVPSWAEGAIRWQAASASDGRVRFLLQGSNPGVMTIDGQGQVEARKLVGRLAAVGARGLLVAPDGTLSETTDAGRTWHVITPPPGGVDAETLHCNEGGCTVGPWHRLGWGAQ